MDIDILQDKTGKEYAGLTILAGADVVKLYSGTRAAFTSCVIPTEFIDEEFYKELMFEWTYSDYNTTCNGTVSAKRIREAGTTQYYSVVGIDTNAGNVATNNEMVCMLKVVRNATNYTIELLRTGYFNTSNGWVDNNGTSFYIFAKRCVNFVNVFTKDEVYPVGTIYETTNSAFDTAAKWQEFIKIGTWEEFGSGRVLAGYNASDADFNAAAKTGGTKAQALPKHTHTTYAQGRLPGGGTSGVMYLNGNGSVSGSLTLTTSEAGVTLAGNENLAPYIVVYRYRRVS